MVPIAFAFHSAGAAPRMGGGHTLSPEFLRALGTQLGKGGAAVGTEG